MCRVLIGQSDLIAWVWILAIAIAIGPLFVRSITKIFRLVEIIKFEKQCCHLLIGPLLFFRFLEKQLLKIADEGNSILFCLKNVVYYKLRDKTVVQILVINIGTFFACSYNVFLADLKLL